MDTETDYLFVRHLLLVHLPPWLVLCRDRELAAVKINQADVEIIVAEIEVDQKQADRRLREHNGHVVEALKSYL